ncbi:MAG: bifunctional metallophosphatase/5'-nucleotidase [Bacillota bacterium]|nr:bifunctional metallophosphatase/5'-nucleotidase [Bacillota bacterium]
MTEKAKPAISFFSKIRFLRQSRALMALIIFFLFFLATGASAEDEIYFTILHTNDEHSALIPHSPAIDYHPERDNPTVGGFARLASAVNQIREDREAVGQPVLLFSAGDYMGESPFSWLIPLGLAPELNLMQLIGYDAAVIGNHEYDYGPDILAKYLLEAGYPAAHDKTVIIASNTVAPSDHPLARDGLYRSNHLITLDNGLVIGIFGLIGEQAISYTTANEPVEFADQHETARQMIEELQQQGADVIIAITHSRVEEDQELAREVPGIHLIIGGHSHTVLEEPVIENGVIIVQAGSQLQYLGQLELAFNTGSGELRLRNAEVNDPYLIPLDHNIPINPEINELIEQYTAELNYIIAARTDGKFQHILDTVMLSNFELSNKPPLKESSFGNFVSDAMRLITEEKIGRKVDFAIQANGAIRGSVNPGTMPHSMGKVSVYDLVQQVGLGIGPDGEAGYSLVAAYLTGEEIRRALEVAVLLSDMMGDTFFLQFSGLRYDYNPQNAILFTVPIMDLPIPTTRAVISAERYTGDGRQGNDDSQYQPIERGDEQLYCLVTDSYIVSFLPMVGELLPQLELVLKDSEGNPVPEDEFDRLVVRVDGKEIKVWEAVLEYAAAQTVGNSGLPEIDSYYSSTGGRINPSRSFPLVILPILLLLLIIFGIYMLIRKIRSRRKTRKSREVE